MIANTCVCTIVIAMLAVGCVSDEVLSPVVSVDVCDPAILRGTAGYVALIKTGVTSCDAIVSSLYDEIADRSVSEVRPCFYKRESYQVFCVNRTPVAAFKIIGDGVVEKIALAGIETIPHGYVLWHDYTRRNIYFKCPRYVEYIRRASRVEQRNSGRQYFVRVADAEM